MPKAIIFDLGDTLLNFGRVQPTGLFMRGARLSYDYLKKLGQPVPIYAVYCVKNLAAIRFRHMWSTVSSNDFSARELLKNINKNSGFNLTEQQWDELVWLWYEPLSELGTVEPDITETLEKLRQMNLKLAILSNTFVDGSSLEKHLAKHDMLKFFDVKMYSYQFSFRKPDPRIFRQAAEKLQLSPSEIVFVGDRIDKDIKPALKVGMKAVLKAAYTNKYKCPPHNVPKIETIRELPAVIEKINS
ncbi:MAG: HAD family hydrolase [Phycisphaerae bacterium]|nr:HAD family hydrolase [Phycisphaerae bacterium]